MVPVGRSTAVWGRDGMLRRRAMGTPERIKQATMDINVAALCFTTLVSFSQLNTGKSRFTVIPDTAANNRYKPGITRRRIPSNGPGFKMRILSIPLTT